MNGDNYEQVIVPKDVIGDQAAYLQEGMRSSCRSSTASPSRSSCPPRVTLEVVETEPAMKGQTASSSYKPAKLNNGLRVMVPPHIGVGARIVVLTEDDTYVERAKD